MVHETKLSIDPTPTTFRRNQYRKYVKSRDKFWLMTSMPSLVHFYSLLEIFDWFLRNRTLNGGRLYVPVTYFIKYLCFGVNWYPWCYKISRAFHKVQGFPIYKSAFLLTSGENILQSPHASPCVIKYIC